MTNNNCVVAVFQITHRSRGRHQRTEQVGFDMKKLSIIGRDYHTMNT